jgi:hypothetical protein
MCLQDPAGEPPMIIYREQEMAPSVLDDMLRKAWHQCGLPALPFPCVYQKDLGNKPQTKACLDQAEKAYLQGEKQCDAKLSPYDHKACSNAYNQCLQKQKVKNYAACQKEVPCAFGQGAKDHFACMKPFEKKRNEAKALCEE